jgi:hypothetical protein
MLTLLVFTYFTLMAGLDFVVHHLLYDYGLRFSYTWASFYWFTFGSAIMMFGCITGFAYWFGSQKTSYDVKVGLGLSLSVCLLSLGGLEDVLWFVLWNGGLPKADVVWWWMPWCRLFGFWNSESQLGLLTIVSVVICLFWIQILNNRKKI